MNIWVFFPNLALVEYSTKWIRIMRGPGVTVSMRFLAVNNLCYSLADNGLKYLILDFTLLSKGSVLCNNLIELGDFDCIRICWGGRNCRLNRIVQIDAEHFVFRWPYSVSIVIYRMFISVGQVGNSFFKLDMCNKIRIEFLPHYRLLFKLLFQDLLKTPHFFNLNLAELSLGLINCMYSVLLNFSSKFFKN